MLGPTTLLQLPADDLASVQRWHSKEWAQFLAEVKTYKRYMHNIARDLVNFHREHCVACKKVKSLYHQRGSIILAAFGVPAAVDDCTFTASTIPPLIEVGVSPADAYTRARLHSDGDWYSNAAPTSSWGTSDGTWQGGCAIADYDTRWQYISGDIPNNVVSGTINIWSAATESKAVGYVVTGIDTLNGSFELECRDGTSLNVLFSDAFTMFCGVEV